MNRQSLRAILALLGVTVLAVAATDAGAVVTARWVVDTYKDWDAGEGESVLVTSDGEIKPGWDTKRTSLEVDGVWAMERMSDGSLVLGTDDNGAIYQVKGGKATVLAKIKDALAITALAVGADGTVYAGTMPGGQVWKIERGTASKLVELKDAETVWALAIDAGGTALYAGTGPDGALFSIDLKSGKAKVAFDTEDKRIMSLAATADGAIWLGTSEKAMVFRYDPKKGTARAMADFDGNEVTALAAHGFDVIAAANEFKEPTGSGARSREAATKGTKKEKATKGETIDKPKTGEKPGADKADPTNAQIKRPGERKGKGGLFRIETDGRLEQIHALTATYYASVAVTPMGEIFAGAGDKGRIYHIDDAGAVSTAFDVSERVVAGIVADKRGTSFATADAAAVYDATGAASKAVYTSKVQDLKTAARFGRFVWRGQGKMQIETRTGNTAEPGIGWSKWAAPGKAGRAGGESWGGAIASPPGRYLQFRVKFNGDASAVLRSATVYHLPQNRPTKLESIEVDADIKSGVTLASGAAKPRSPVVKIKWNVDNPDKDDTVYELSVRREGDARWRALTTGGKPLTTRSYEWNTETFPDGYYQLRVRASDSRANSADRAMGTTKTTPLFLIDNAKPVLSGLTVRAPAVSARATDGMSAIAEASFSVDDGPWQLIATDDGLFDELSETLSFKLPADLAAGAHTLAIRVADEAGNIGSASVTFRISR